jgi:hypothetical protein
VRSIVVWIDRCDGSCKLKPDVFMMSIEGIFKDLGFYLGTSTSTHASLRITNANPPRDTRHNKYLALKI